MDNFSLLIPHIIGYLQIEEVVKLASLSQSTFKAIQSTDTFWKNLDLSCNTFPYCTPQLKSLLASRLSQQGNLIKGINFAFSRDFDDTHISLLPSDIPNTNNSTPDPTDSTPDPTGSNNIEKSLPGLHHLNLNGCEGVSDDGLIILASRSKHLKSLELYWNFRVTDRGLIPILQSSSKTLEKLNLSGGFIIFR